MTYGKAPKPPLSPPAVLARKGGEPIVCLTAYTTPIATLYWLGTALAWCCTACPIRSGSISI